MVIFDSAVRGTAADEWTSVLERGALTELDLDPIERLTVVAAHPDDETLGAGGLITVCAERGIPVQVIVVTDGAASHPHSPTTTPRQLAGIRQRELFLAIAELAPATEVVMLGFPDGHTDQSRGAISERLAGHLERGSTLVVPWRGDGHRDHRVVGEACFALADQHRLPVFEYPIWMWHWADPDGDDVPWRAAVQLPLGDTVREAKRRAIDRHTSQVIGFGQRKGDGPVLEPNFVEHFTRDRELFFHGNS
jgi:LmbE family N-acetylglucosaminyl deacetylase